MPAHRTLTPAAKLPLFKSFRPARELRFSSFTFLLSSSSAQSLCASLPTTRCSLSLSPLSTALPYIFVVTPLSTAFTHFDRGGGVKPFFSRFFTSHEPAPFRPAPSLSGTGSPITSHVFSVACTLFVAASRPPSFLFRSLQTLFANSGGGTSAQLSALCASALSWILSLGPQMGKMTR